MSIRIVDSTDVSDPLVATDTIGGVDYQVVKIAAGGAGTATQLTGDASNGLDVDVTRVTGTVTVSQTQPATAAVTRVTASVSTGQLLAANTARRGATFYNESTAILYLKWGTTASTTSYTVQIPAAGYYELPQYIYTGRVDGIWSAANGAVQVTEAT